MSILKNHQLEVELNAKGAEIIRMVGLKDQTNYMWRRDPVLWANSAPILFPIVGSVRNNEYRIDGKTYHLTQHGFARHHLFEEIQKDDNTVVYVLTPNEAISQLYPYHFKLEVTYTLHESSLICDIQVVNTDKEDIVFGVGGHPAFACPFYENESSNDYYLEFSEEETLQRKMIDVKENGFSHQCQALFDHEKRFFIRQAMFDDNAIVVENFKSENVALRSIHHNKAIIFHMKNFNHLGIWGGSHVGGLIAIEPWNSHADFIDFKGELKEKEGIIALKPAESFSCQFIIEIQQ